MARYSWLAVAMTTLAACGGQSAPTETAAPPTPTPAPALVATPAPVAQTPCDPFATVEEPYPLGPYGFAGRAGDRTVYAIDGTDFDVRVLVSGHDGILRQQRPTKYAASDANDGSLEWEFEGGTRLYSTAVVLAGDLRRVPIAISRGGQREVLTPLSADEKAKLDVRRTVPALPFVKAVSTDGSRLLIVYREYYGDPPGGLYGRYTAFYGQPPTIAERRIVEWQNDGRHSQPFGVTLDVDGSPMSVPVSKVMPSPGPSSDPTNGFATGLTFTCR